jgi:putative membrane protein
MKRVVSWWVLSTIPVLALGAGASPDASFFKSAAEGGISEVNDGTLAQQKGASQAVKDFGAMMVKDHSAANDKLKAIAAQEDVSLPSSASAMQMATHAKLDMMSGETFDKAYIRGQIKAHQATAALFQKEIASGQDEKAKQFATSTLPVVQSHLKAIMQIAANAGISAK